MPEEDKNVYILGAGFSQQLGLPLQNDFLLTAKSVYFRSPQGYQHFQKVFQYADKLSRMRNYLSYPLLNLENLFNLLEMDIFYSGSEDRSELKKDFVKLIKDVLSNLTPNPFFHDVDGKLRIDTQKYSDYLKFIQLFVMNKALNTHNDVIISFNYDLVVETATSLFNWIRSQQNHPGRLSLNVTFGKTNIAVEKLSDYFETGRGFEIPFNTQTMLEPHPQEIRLIKLHGSINWKVDDSDETFIVPPTWNKSDQRIRRLWEIAYQQLSQAKRIIVVGYSFPETDIYVKSLLGLAINNNEQLQTIVFINPDKGSTRERCLSFIDEHFRRNCDYKEWDFHGFINNNDGFMETKLNRTLKV